jgi:GNAT superfamily N-acetyltransferase
MTSAAPGRPPSRPDSSDPATAAIQDQAVAFFAALLPANEPDAPGCFRRITGQPHPLGNLAMIGPGVAPATIAEVATALVPLPSAVILLGGDDETQATPLTNLGFVLEESMCLMSVTRAQLTPTQMPDGYHFVELTPADDERFTDAFAAGYELPRPYAAVFSPGAAARSGVSWRYFGAEQAKGGPLAAVSVCAVIDGRPGIYCVATLPEHRAKGLAAHLTAEPLRLAWKDGHTGAMLQSSAMGESVYRRIGFQSHGHMALYLRIPGAD